MNVDRALVRSKKLINILWSVVLLAIVAYIAYYWIKKQRKKKKAHSYEKKRLTLAKKREKIEKEEETSLVQYPSFDLSSPLLDLPEVEEGAGEAYSYNDLLKVVQNKDGDFFEGYCKAVIMGLKYKFRRYSRILESKYQQKEKRDESQQIKPGHLQTIDVCIVIEDILKLIEFQIKTITADKIASNFEKMIHHPEKGLESLVERREVKDMIAQQIFAFKRHQKHFYTSHQNGLVMGKSGIGKSKICMVIAYCLHMAGMMVKDAFICVSADKIVSPFVDDTPRTCREFFESHLEKVVLLEEIYSTTPKKTLLGDENRSHGQQAITQIVALTEEYKGLCRIYGNGYLDETVEQFIRPNEGMERRFPLIIELQPFTTKGLAQILIRFLATNADFNLSEQEAAAVYGMIIKAKEEDPGIFDKEAGSMENLANDISNTVYNSKGGQWIAGNSDHNIKMLMRGFNRYKRAKVTPVDPLSSTLEQM